MHYLSDAVTAAGRAYQGQCLQSLAEVTLQESEYLMIYIIIVLKVAHII